MSTEREIKAEIQKLRVQMGRVWDERGETDRDILRLSVEMDRLMNQYYRLKSGPEN